MRPFELTAVALVEAYSSGALSPLEAMRDVLQRVAAVRTAYSRDLSLGAGARARRGARVRGALAARRADGPARRRARDRQRQHRHQGRADSTRHRGERARARRGRRAARGAVARSRRHSVRQDDDAGLRHVVVGPFELSRARAQPLESIAQSRRLVGRRGGGGGGRLRTAASGHRHRRLGAPSGGLVRRLRTEAERRARADRSALYRARRRADHAQRRRRGADDGDAFAARCARHHEFAAAELGLARRADRPSRPAHRPAHASRLRRRRDGAGPRRSRARGARSCGRRRDRRAARAVPDPGDARRARPLLADALAHRSARVAARAARKNPAVHPRLGGIRRPASAARRCFTASARSWRCAKRRSQRRCPTTSCCRPRRRSPPTPPKWPRRAATRSTRFPTSASPSPSICPSSRRRRSIVATTTRACRSACRSSAAASTTSACSALAMAFEAMRAAEARAWPEPPGVARYSTKPPSTI